MSVTASAPRGPGASRASLNLPLALRTAEHRGLTFSSSSGI